MIDLLPNDSVFKIRTSIEETFPRCAQPVSDVLTVGSGGKN